MNDKKYMVSINHEVIFDCEVIEHATKIMGFDAEECAATTCMKIISDFVQVYSEGFNISMCGNKGGCSQLFARKDPMLVVDTVVVYEIKKW